MTARTVNKTTAAGIAGAVIGAGITAAAVALSDKNTREKVTHRLIDAKKKAQEMLTNAGKKAEETGKEARKAMEAEKQMLEDIKPLDDSKTVHRST